MGRQARGRVSVVQRTAWSQAWASRVGLPRGSPELGSPPLRGSSPWFRGLGDSSLSLELTSEFESTFVKADAAAEPRIPELEALSRISSAARNKSPVTIWQFYRPYVTDGRRAENKCAGERQPGSLSAAAALWPGSRAGLALAGRPCGLFPACFSLTTGIFTRRQCCGSSSETGLAFSCCRPSLVAQGLVVRVQAARGWQLWVSPQAGCVDQVQQHAVGV